MTVYTRPGSPYWYYDMPDPGVPGGRRRRSTKVRAGTTTRETKASRIEAEAIAARALASVGLGPVHDMTLEQALDSHIASLRADGKPTWRSYETIRDKMLGRSADPTRWRLDGSRTVGSIRPADIKALRVHRAQEGNKPATIANELRLLRAACRAAKSDGAAPAQVEKWHVPPTPPRMRYLTVEEWHALYARLDPNRLVHTRGGQRQPSGQLREQAVDAQDLALFLVGTGARWAEAATLTWRQVSFEEARVTLFGKGRKSRPVPMPPDVIAMLRRRAERPRGALVFPGKDGSARAAPSRALVRAMDDLGLNPEEAVANLGSASCHTLRHTYASWARQRGIGIDELQVLLGHASVTTTMRYAKIQPAEVFARVLASMPTLAGNGSNAAHSDGQPAA